MNIITEPTVELFSRPMFVPNKLYELPPHGCDAENIIATGGKVCFDSYGLDGRSVSEHIQRLNESGHGSVLEHANFGVFLAGISRGCSHEIVRHRHFSYSQRSTRYTAEGDASIVLDPYYAEIYRRFNENQDNTTPHERVLLNNFIEGCSHDIADYQQTVGLLGSMSEDARVQQGIPTDKVGYRKWCRGKARQRLPHALETRMVMTGNIRAWKEFLIKRTSQHAEAEIRRLAEQIWLVLAPEAPVAFGDLHIAYVNGFIELT